MATLNHSTVRRLKNLPQIPSVWEGDRRPMATDSHSNIDTDSEATGECIIWVDGSQGMVRAMDMVAPDMGPEAIVRTLLRAIEHPQSPAPVARPQKIVVKDREIQFFLRGILQDLEIVIEYVPDLPLIDEIFRGLQEVAQSRPPQLPAQYAKVVMEKAYQIWQDAPWEHLGDHQIIAVELNLFGINTLYISTLGKLGMDYGVLLYRSLDSLRRFRERIVRNKSYENLEEAFLTQDCLFVTFDRTDGFDEDEDEDDDDFVSITSLSSSEIEPNFGNLHPLEGLRSILYDEEAAIVLIALEAFHRFLRDHRQKLAKYQFPSLNRKYRIPVDLPDGEKKQVSVKVETLPDIADELASMVADDDSDDDDEMEVDVPRLRDDLVPPKSFLSLGVVPWETTKYLRSNTQFHQAAETEITEVGDGLPVVVIQTTKPKAEILIRSLQEAGGLEGICFNPGEDPTRGCNYDLGILKTEDGDLHLFGEFMEDDPVHQEARKKWEQRCKKTKGWCGLIIAMGLTGASRGQPQFKDMMALLEVRFIPSEDLDLGRLQLIPVEF